MTGVYLLFGDISHGLQSPARRLDQFNTWRPRQNGRHFADDISKYIFLNENVWKPTKISLYFVLQGPINNIPALVQIMAWRRPGDKPLPEPMMVSLPTHICGAQTSSSDLIVCSQQISPTSWKHCLQTLKTLYKHFFYWCSSSNFNLSILRNYITSTLSYSSVIWGIVSQKWGTVVI